MIWFLKLFQTCDKIPHVKILKNKKSYDYFKIAHKHDVKQDVAKTLQFWGFLCQYLVFFSKVMF